MLNSYRRSNSAFSQSPSVHLVSKSFQILLALTAVIRLELFIQSVQSQRVCFSVVNNI